MFVEIENILNFEFRRNGIIFLISSKYTVSTELGWLFTLFSINIPPLMGLFTKAQY